MVIEEAVEARGVAAIGIAILSTGVAILGIDIALLGVGWSIGIAILTTDIAILTGIAVLTRGIAITCIGVAILTHGIPIAEAPVVAVEIFRSHERVGPLGDLLSHAGVILEIRIERRMVLDELRIVDQGRRLAQLIGNFAMGIEKLVKPGQVPAGDVIAADIVAVLGLDSPLILRGRRLCVRGIWETQRDHGCTENEGCLLQSW
jgi:hypothetical protein